MFRKAGVVKPRLFACFREFLKGLLQGAEIIVAQRRPQPFKFIFRQFINRISKRRFMIASSNLFLKACAGFSPATSSGAMSLATMLPTNICSSVFSQILPSVL